MATLDSANSFIEKRIDALDGLIGHISEFYFNDQSGHIKYIVVDEGNVFTHKKILITPELIRINETDQTLHIEMTRKDFKNISYTHNEKPIIDQKKANMHEHYDWEIYMGSEVLLSNPKHETSFLLEPKNPDGSFFDSHLRTTRVVTGYMSQFNDGLNGKIIDFMIDPHKWNIDSFVILSQHGDEIHLPWGLLKSISFDERKINFNTTQDKFYDHVYMKEA